MEIDDDLRWGEDIDDIGELSSPEFRIFPPELPTTKIDETTDRNFPFQKDFETIPLPESYKQQSMPLTELLLRTNLSPELISRHGKKTETHDNEPKPRRTLKMTKLGIPPFIISSPPTTLTLLWGLSGFCPPKLGSLNTPKVPSPTCSILW